MNEPDEFEITVPEGVLPEDEAPAPEAPVPEVPGSATYVLPEGYITAEAPPPEPPVEGLPAEQPPAEEPPIMRHDPFAYMRGAPWMNRNLSPSGRAAIGQGGEFDYQRKAAVGGKDGFVQLRQFRNVSNFNVGLYMQQAGFPLKATLGIAGWYAEKNSGNYSPSEPHGLERQTREFIELGYAAGKSGIFD